VTIHIIYFGMNGIFSRPPLEGLLASGVEVSSVIMAAASNSGKFPLRRVEPAPPVPSALPVVDPYLNSNIVHLAWANHIPVWEVESLSAPQTLALLAGLQPDLIVVACFPYIFPAPVLQLPRYGCLNLHPSLLPAFRGPMPLFWMARQGEHRAGVTLHFMNEGADTGDIVAQTAFDWPDGISGPDLEQCCAVEGGQLLLSAVQHLAQGGKLARRPQPQTGSSYFSWPADDDLLIPTDWPAYRAFNFLRVAANWPLTIVVGTQRFPVSRALGYEANLTIDQPYRFEGDELWIQLQPGVLRVQ
jgi:methionyl-tRNA formyltransferase